MKHILFPLLIALALPAFLALRWAFTDVEAARAEARADIKASMAAPYYQAGKAAWEARR